MIFRQNLGINRFHRTVVICTFKIQIYLRVCTEIFTRYQNIYGHCTYIVGILCSVVVFMINLGNSLARFLGKIWE